MAGLELAPLHLTSESTWNYRRVVALGNRMNGPIMMSVVWWRILF
jgi:hypothetical protein